MRRTIYALSTLALLAAPAAAGNPKHEGAPVNKSVQFNRGGDTTNRNTSFSRGGEGGKGGIGYGGTALAGGGSGGSASSQTQTNVSVITEAATSSAIATSGNSTAPCQGYASGALQFVNFGGGLSFSRTVKFCRDIFVAQEVSRMNPMARAIWLADNPRYAKVLAAYRRK